MEWPLAPVCSPAYNFSAYTSGDGIINSSGSANVKGAYEAVVNATAFPIDWLSVTLLQATAAVRDLLLDIAIGGAGSETVIVSNILYSLNTLAKPTTYVFPIAIPEGTSIRARCQASAGSTGVEIFLKGYRGAFPGFAGFGRVETWGADTSDSGGTTVDSGGSIGVKGAYAQLIAATAFDTKWLTVALGNRANTARTTMVGDVDIAIGPGGSEQVIIPDLRYYAHATDDYLQPGAYYAIPMTIPAGSRVAARHVNYNTADATDRLIDVAAYGIG
jgi:hypothetical protein